MIVVLALVANRKDRYRFAAFDLEQCDITGSAEGNEQFPQEGIARSRLAAGEWKVLQQFSGLFDRFQGAFGDGQSCSSRNAYSRRRSSLAALV